MALGQRMAQLVLPRSWQDRHETSKTKKFEIKERQLKPLKTEMCEKIGL